MQPLNVSSTSLLKSIVPAIISIFVYFFPEIAFLLIESGEENIAISNLSKLLSPTILIVFVAVAIVWGKVINFIRLKVFPVPNYLKRTVNQETNDVMSLSRVERIAEIFNPEFSTIADIIARFLLIHEFEKIAVAMYSETAKNNENQISGIYLAQGSNKRSRMYKLLFSGKDLLDIETRQQIIADIRKKYDLNNVVNPETFYSIILNDISGSKSKETREIESVYISYKNTSISLISIPIARLYFDVPHVKQDWTIIFITLSSFGFIMLFYAGLLGVGKIYTKQILLEYYMKNSNED